MTQHVLIRCGDLYWDGRYWGDSGEAKAYAHGSKDLKADLNYLNNIARIADAEDRMTPTIELV